MQMGQSEESAGGRTVRIGRRVEAAMGGLDGNELSSPLGLVGSGFGCDVGVDLGFERPETMGGGSSRPSAALRLSWRAKSLACHHSRNLRAKMLVGRRMERLLSSLGYSVLGLKMLVVPGLSPSLG